MPPLFQKLSWIAIASLFSLTSPIWFPPPVTIAQVESSQKKIEADTLLQQARAQVQANELTAAIASLQQALRLYRTLRDGPGEMQIWRNLGNVDYLQGKFEQAIEHYQKSLKLARSLADRRGEASALQNLGVVYAARQQWQQAQDVQEAALVLVRQLQDRTAEQETLSNLGQIALATQDFPQAIARYQQSLQLAAALNDTAGVITTLNQLGQAYSGKGDDQQAIALHRQALALAQAQQNQEGARTALFRLGQRYQAIGADQPAIAMLQQSLALTRPLEHQQEQLQAFSSLGELSSRVGDTQQARQYFRQSVGLARFNQNFAAQAQALGNLAETEATLGQLPQAMASVQRGLRLQERTRDRQHQAALLNQLGEVYQQMGGEGQAIAAYQRSLQLARKTQDLRGQQAALIHLGRTYTTLRDYNQAIDSYQQALALAKKAQDRLGEGLTLTFLGQTQLASGQIAAATQGLNQATQIFAHSNLENRVEPAVLNLLDRLLQQALITQNQPEAALVVLERTRTREFAAILTDSSTTLPLTTAPNLTQIQDLARSRNKTLVSYAFLSTDTRYHGQTQSQESVLLTWVVQPNGTIHFRQVNLADFWRQQEVENHRVHSVADLVKSAQAAIGLKIPEFATPVTIQAIGNRPFGPHTKTRQLQQLYRLLIAPIAELLPANPEASVIFIPPAPLLHLPFAALQSPDGTYLIEQHAIALLPSIQALAESTPDSSSDEEDETASPTFTPPTMTVFTPPKQVNPSVLLGAIANSNPPASLVIMTPEQGKALDSRDPSHFTWVRSLMLAGIPNVMLPLWPSTEQANTLLMSEFYRNLQQGRPNAQALREAMLVTMQRHPNPKDWASISLWGKAE